MLIVGIIIGAGLIFGTIYGETTFLSKAMAESPSQATTRIVTVTKSEFIFPSSTQSFDSSVTTVSSSEHSEVIPNAVLCYAGGTEHEANATYPHAGCILQLSNSSNTWVTVEVCSFNGTGGGFGTLESDGTPTSITVKPGAHPTAYCLAPSTLNPTYGAIAFGTFLETSGKSTPFSGTWQ
jgi:hypothetical protein